MEGELAADAGPVDIDHAAVRRDGTDVSLITYGGSLPKALAAADELAREGIDAEVIDLRTLRPLDVDAIVAIASRRPTAPSSSTRAGGRGSLAAEIRARIIEQRVLRARRAGRPGVQRRGADPVREAPRGRGAAAGRRHRRGSHAR